MIPGSPPSLRDAEVPIELLVVEPGFNVRTHYRRIPELAESINAQGQLTPILVEPLPDGRRLMIVSGHRRHKALLVLKWPTARVTIRPPGKDARLTNLAENTGRDDLRLYDQTKRFAELAKEGIAPAVLAAETGVPQSRVNQMILVWERLHPALKERWALIGDPAVEPSLIRLGNWTRLEAVGQVNAWNNHYGSGDEVDEQKLFDENFDPPRPPKRRRTTRTWSEVDKERLEAVQRYQYGPNSVRAEITAEVLAWVQKLPGGRIKR